jgi:hypothetical protein
MKIRQGGIIPTSVPLAAQLDLFESVNDLMKVEDKLSAIGDEESPLNSESLCVHQSMYTLIQSEQRTLLLQRFHLLEECGDVYDDAVADQTDALRVHEPGREQVERKGLAVCNDGVPSVVSACASRADVNLVAKHVDELALALIAPLRAEDDSH